jgi:diaminohydroxyphosphoribosylaminopyrimidine deaminase/5-amino-6-(5-phosphoribosylamino)uracil reductase
MNPNNDWMVKAIQMAQKGGRQVSPNPLVGALVIKGSRLISSGYHSYFGGPHAEIIALKKAGKKSRGATLYVTLEPCASWGKTPPCVDRVIASGVKKVIIASEDPNPQNRRKGILKLKNAGIKVRVGVLKDKVKEQNEGFFSVHRKGLPFVTLKMAQSLDGKIATKTGKSRWISSSASRKFVHELRDSADAVLVGKGTAFTDNPRLAGTRNGEKPWRVVIDPRLQLSPKARIFQGPQLTFIAVSEKIIGKEKKGSRILIPLPEKRGKLSLKPLLKRLAGLGVNHLLVEGGGEIAWSLISEGLADRLIWIMSPKIIGGRGAKTSVEGEGAGELSRAFDLKWEKCFRLGEDWIFEARPCSQEL